MLKKNSGKNFEEKKISCFFHIKKSKEKARRGKKYFPMLLTREGKIKIIFTQEISG